MVTQLPNIVESEQPEQLATGFEFTEGPLWHPDGYWLFVDIRRTLIHRLVPGGKPEVERENSGGSNGLTFDLHGRMVICEGDNRRVTRRESDGSYTPIAERLQTKRNCSDFVGSGRPAASPIGQFSFEQGCISPLCEHSSPQL